MNILLFSVVVIAVGITLTNRVKKLIKGKRGLNESTYTILSLSVCTFIFHKNRKSLKNQESRFLFCALVGKIKIK